MDYLKSARDPQNLQCQSTAFISKGLLTMVRKSVVKDANQRMRERSKCTWWGVEERERKRERGVLTPL